MHPILIIFAALAFDGARRRLRAIRRRNTAEAAMFRVLGVDGSPRAYDEFANDPPMVKR